MKLSELPGYHIANSDLGKDYAKELRQVQAPDELFAFVRRWSALWEIGRDRSPEVMHPMLDRIVGCKFDAEEALDCIQKCSESACKHVGLGETCPGMNIVLPVTLLQAEMISNKFGAPICAALHQAFCKDPNHSDCF
jgi:hypothetical protein